MFLAVAEVAVSDEDLPAIKPRLRGVVGGLKGLTFGAVRGALFGIMAVAFIGAALGGIAGILLRRLPGDLHGRFRFFHGRVIFAAACGVAAQAFYLDWVTASEGLRLGATVGLASGVLFSLAVVPLAFLTVRN